MEVARRAAKHTQSREEWWRGPGGQPNTLRAGRSGGGGQEGSQTTLRAGRSGGGGQEGSQTHSEPGGVVEGYITMTNALRAGRSGGVRRAVKRSSELGGAVHRGHA